MSWKDNQSRPKKTSTMSQWSSLTMIGKLIKILEVTQKQVPKETNIVGAKVERKHTTSHKSKKEMKSSIGQILRNEI